MINKLGMCDHENVCNYFEKEYNIVRSEIQNTCKVKCMWYAWVE